MDVGVIGGSMAGLAAAERFSNFVGSVTVYERQEYGPDRRVDCGEGITSPDLIPVAKTDDNGFVNECPSFVVKVQPIGGEVLAETPLDCGDSAYITDRQIVETAWADRLRQWQNVTIEAGTTISRDEYVELVEEHDLVVDASGSPSLSARLRGFADEYMGEMIALNATVDGDFSDFNPKAWVIFEGYQGYFWVFPKSDTRANVGIGWAQGAAPDHYYKALEEACQRHDVRPPHQDDVNLYTIPSGPSIDPALIGPLPKWHNGPSGTQAPVFQVGDAAGIANRYQGEGITQAIESSYLLAELVRQGGARVYGKRLYEKMKSEYVLAALMKGAWDHFQDPELIASLARSIQGLSLHEVTREPRKVMLRLARHPRLAAKMLSNREYVRSAYSAYQDTWEFGRVGI